LNDATQLTRDIAPGLMSKMSTTAKVAHLNREPTENRMNRMMSRWSPSATTMIRMDHTSAMMTFHKYHVGTSPDRKRAIAETLGLALEIHATLEEEIFYPAMRSVHPDLVDKSIPEHGEMRRLIAQLRQMRPEDRSFDTTMMELMRDVIRHVADEETMQIGRAHV